MQGLSQNILLIILVLDEYALEEKQVQATYITPFSSASGCLGAQLCRTGFDTLHQNLF